MLCAHTIVRCRFIRFRQLNLRNLLLCICVCLNPTRPFVCVFSFFGQLIWLGIEFTCFEMSSNQLKLETRVIRNALEKSQLLTITLFMCENKSHTAQWKTKSSWFVFKKHSTHSHKRLWHLNICYVHDVNRTLGMSSEIHHKPFNEQMSHWNVSLKHSTDKKKPEFFIVSICSDICSVEKYFT